MKLTWLAIDIDCQEGEEKALSTEYISQGNTHQFTLYLPFCIVQVKSRWEEE